VFPKPGAEKTPHSTDKTIRDIGSKIDTAMEAPEPEAVREIPRIQRAG
jgi:hypothetical protein